MKSICTGPLLAVLLSLPLLATAADDVRKEPRKTTPLGMCSKEAHARGLKADERKKFIASCIAASKQGKATQRAPASP